MMRTTSLSILMTLDDGKRSLVVRDGMDGFVSYIRDRKPASLVVNGDHFPGTFLNS